MLINLEDFKSIYMQIENARMELWSLLGAGNLDIPEINEIIADMVHTENRADCLKITIDDILPRDVFITKGKREININKNTLQYHWMGLVASALKGIERTFHKALVVIKIYSPAPYWDTDNRCHKYIIDALRYNKIIHDDDCKNMSYMVIGEVDRDYPRTEIYVLDHPDGSEWFLPGKN